MKELSDSVLQQFGITICRNCLVQYRRTTDVQEKLELKAQEYIAKVQELMRKDAYLLTISMKCQKS